jgi:hypothetical protein
MKLNESLKSNFKSILHDYHESLGNPSLTGPLDFINRTIVSFQQVNISSGTQKLKIRSKKISRTQKIRFYPYGPLFPDKYTNVELEGLLFIHKHILKGKVDSYRATTIQVVFTKSKEKLWTINTNQFSFLIQWQRFKIAPAFSKWYSLKPRMLTWATYGFLGPHISKYPFYYSSKRMFNYTTTLPTTQSFKFPVNTRIGWDSSTSFLHKFVQGLVGENLLTNTSIKLFVDDMYSLVKWKSNHKKELKMSEAKNGDKYFGIIEFTVTSGK